MKALCRFANYGENAKILADSPAAAGDRLNTEFSNLKQNFGGLFANIGANIQDFTTRFLKSLNDLLVPHEYFHNIFFQ